MCTNHPEPLETTHSPRWQKPPISWCAENTSVGQLKSANPQPKQQPEFQGTDLYGMPQWPHNPLPSRVSWPAIPKDFVKNTAQVMQTRWADSSSTIQGLFPAPSPGGCVYKDPICKLTPLLCLCCWKQVAGNKSQVRWQQQKWKSGGVGIPEEREETSELMAWTICGNVMRRRSKDAEIMTLNVLFLCQRNDGYNHASSHTDRGMENVW